MKKRHTIDMTKGSIAKQMLLFAIPLILDKILHSLYGIADKAMLGQMVGDNAMAAVSVTSTPYNLVYNLFAGLTLGALVCCGNYLGAKDQKSLRITMHNSLLLGVGIGALVGLLGLLFSRPLLMLTGVPENLMEDALTYFRFHFLSSPITLLSAFTLQILNAHGDTMRNTLFGAVSGLLNVALNYVFLKLIPLGVAGVALATMLSNLMVLICRLYLVFSKNGAYRLRLRELIPHWPTLKKMVGIGVPNGLNSTVFSVSNTILHTTINSFGSTVIAGYSAAISVADLASIAYTGIPPAAIAAISQCCGARQWGRSRKVVNKAILLCHAITVPLSAGCILFNDYVLRMFTDTPAVIEAAFPCMLFYCSGYFFHTFGQIYVAGIKGLRYSTTAFLVNVLSICVPRVLWVLFIVPLKPTTTVLYAIYPISWLISAIFLGIFFYRCLRKAQEKAAVLEG